jgi:hypothetical protein
MFSRRPTQRGPFAGGFGAGSPGGRFGAPGSREPVPRDLLALLVVAAVTFSLQLFTRGAAFADLLLTPNVWLRWHLWQLATYAFIGPGAAAFWFLISLWMLYMFGRDVHRQVGRRGFWTLLAWSVVGGALIACLVQFTVGRWISSLPPFSTMQGTNMLLVVLVCAFATLYRNATIYLMFVLPIRAVWFIPLEIALAFIGFLASHDLAGFVGICGAIGITYSLLTPGGLRRLSREGWLRLQKLWIEQKLDRARRRHNIRPIPGTGGRPTEKVRKGPWVN